jgi:hypothetical protein
MSRLVFIINPLEEINQLIFCKYKKKLNDFKLINYQTDFDFLFADQAIFDDLVTQSIGCVSLFSQIK